MASGPEIIIFKDQQLDISYVCIRITCSLYLHNRRSWCMLGQRKLGPGQSRLVRGKLSGKLGRLVRGKLGRPSMLGRLAWGMLGIQQQLPRWPIEQQ